MKTINIGIVAHVDAGKTSLTERLLYETKVIRELGGVDSGSTQTDSLELERRRGITIKASVVSFIVNEVKINLIDTPGHADFIAEVERAFGVLDGAVLVLSAVEGIQAQTKLLMAVLEKLAIPVILFVNKIDRSGAQPEAVFEAIRQRLSRSAIPLYGTVQAGTKQADIVKKQCSNENAEFYAQCIELAADHDEQLLASYVYGGEISRFRIEETLTRLIREARVYPILAGSAMTGIGINELLEAITRFIPAPQPCADAPLSGVVFKIERASSGEKIAYIRVFSGSFAVRQTIQVNRKQDDGQIEAASFKVKRIQLFDRGRTADAASAGAGEFCKVWGLKEVRIGDVIGTWSERIRELHVAAPQMESRIEAVPKSGDHALYQALMNMAEEDPLIHLWRDEHHRETYIRLFGEVQKEVIEATLKEAYQLDVRFAETRIVCIEKPRGTGKAVEFMGAEGNPFYATVGFRIDPCEAGSGVTYRLEVELGSLPLAFQAAIEDTVYATLRQGLYGWEVTDIAVTLTHTGYASPVTVAGDFRKLVPLVLMEALSRAGTDVYEPIHEYELTIPAGSISSAMHRLAGLRALMTEPVMSGDTCLLTGTIPVKTAEAFKRSLHAITEGEGVFIARPCGFIRMESGYPVRKRSDYNPLNRKDYLLHVLRAY
ncbi:GTP-binding protein [Paenibacillus dendritiformis]|uniref:GTP-binding protein n=1 Tax=Paenibacillus dendritiformis TaxID=130049 RepID=UPI00387E1EA1